MSKLIALATGAAGYVLGARAGRERYTAIVDKATQLWSDPRVQQRKKQVAGAAKATAEQAKARLPSDDDTPSSSDRSTTDGTSTPKGASRNAAEADLTMVNPPRGDAH